MKLKDKKARNKVQRSILTGKVVNNKKIIAVDEAKKYLKKQGYIIVDDKKLVPINKIVDKIRDNGFRIIPEHLSDNILSLTAVFISLGALSLINNLIV